MEGKVYICGWESNHGLFRLWVKKRPKLVVENKDFEDASEALAEKICEAFGDGEAVLEFDPPAPGLKASEVAPAILLLGYNKSVQVLNRVPELYSKGLCPVCREGLGERTAQQLLVDALPSNDIAGLSYCYPSSKIVSEKFLELLSIQERANLKLQPVIPAKKGRRTFFEVTGPPVAHFVGVKGATYNPISCWRCPGCDGLRVYPTLKGKLFRFRRFVSRADLPTQVPSCFALGGQGMSINLCMTAERWRELVGKPGARGITTSPIGVVDASLADYDPPIRRGIPS